MRCEGDAEWVLSVGVLRGGVGVEGVGVLRGWVLTDASEDEGC